MGGGIKTIDAIQSTGPSLDPRILLAFSVFLLVFAVLAVNFIIKSERQRNATLGAAIAKKRVNAKALRQFYSMDKFFLTRSGLHRIHERVGTLGVYTADECKAVSVKLYKQSLFSIFAIITAAAFIYQDVLITLVACLMALAAKYMLVDKYLGKVYYTLLEELRICLSSVRQNYLRLGTIPDAISEAEKPHNLSRVMDEIFHILTEVDSMERLEEFLQSSPIRILQTFAIVCQQVNDTGDTKDGSGASNFLRSLSMMEEEIQMEIRRLYLQKKKFGLLLVLPLTPVIGMGMIENFFVSTIPGTTVIYGGPLGYISKIAVILLCIGGFTMISRLNSGALVAFDDRNVTIVNLLKHKSVKSFVDDITPKDAYKRLAKYELIKKSLSLWDIDQLYLNKVIRAFSVFVLSVFLCVTATSMGRNFLYENVKSASLTSEANLTREEVLLRQRIDPIFLAFPELPSTREMRNFITTYYPSADEFDIQSHSKRLTTKYEAYHNTKFHWWLLLLCYFTAFLGWMSPEFALKFRGTLVAKDAEEDVLQLQTLISSLMHTRVDTQDLLYWMWKSSQVHRRILLNAVHEYPSDPDIAIDMLKQRASSPEFKRMCDKMKLTSNQISIAEAFSDLITERSHIMHMRGITQEASVNAKRAIASPLALAPIYAMVVLTLLVPIIILGVSEITTAMSGFGF